MANLGGGLKSITHRRYIGNRLAFTEPVATNCFGINFDVFANNNQQNFISRDL